MSKVLEFHYYCDNFKAAEHQPRTVEGDTVLVYSPKKGQVVELDLCGECLGLLTLPEIDVLADSLGREIADPEVDASLVCPYGCQDGRPFKSKGGLNHHMTRKHPDHEKEGR